MRSRTGSDASTRSADSSSDKTIPIFVRLLTGETIPLILPISTSVPTLLQLLSLRTSFPPSGLRVTYAGRHLSTSSSDPETLESLRLQPNSTLSLSMPVRGGMPPKKIRCNFKECKDTAQRIVGDCGFCNGHFCGKHRMLEDHKCSGLEDCKKESREQNKMKLESERTVVVKGV